MTASADRPITATTRVAAVIGSPVRHSLSPAIHNAAFAAGDVDWRLVAFDVPAGAGAAAVTSMKALGLGGFSVTTPLKSEVADAVDEVDPAAAALRSVNTVVLRADGSTFGASTDGAGFVDSLTEASVAIDRGRVVVLGAGAASRSIVDALGRAGAVEVVVVNRGAEAAERAAALSPVARVGSVADIAAAALLINATSVGMGVDESPIDPDLLHDGLAVADVVYHPLATRLLREAAVAGARTVDGLGMLVHQAVRQQQLWTGVTPDPLVMRAAAEAELSARR